MDVKISSLGWCSSLGAADTKGCITYGHEYGSTMWPQQMDVPISNTITFAFFVGTPDFEL